MAQTLQVVDTLDTIGATASSIPRGTKRVLAYITGGGGIAWTAQQIAALQAKGVQLALAIDQSNTEQLFTNVRTLIVDDEPGAATNVTSDHIAVRRAARGLRTTLYTFYANFEALKASVAAQGPQVVAHVDYLVAYWDLDRNGAIAFLEQHPECVGVQWASPTSNPNTLVPGSRLTLAEANIDLSVTRADWPGPLPKHKRGVLHHPHVPVPPKPHPKVTAGVLAGALSAGALAVLQAKGIDVTHLNANEREAVSVLAFAIAAYLKKDGLVS